MIDDPLNLLPPKIKITPDDICFLGCSYTAGTGLSDPKTKQASLIAKHLQKKEINLAVGGLTNYDMLDHLAKLEFTEENCILFLEITQLPRVKYYNHVTGSIDKTILSHVNFKHKHLLDTYHDKFLIYEIVNRLFLCLDYLRLKKVKFVVWSIARFNDEFLDNAFESYLSQIPEYIYMDNSLDGPDTYRVDDAEDGIHGQLGTGHPGIESNKIIATKLLTHYNKLYT